MPRQSQKKEETKTEAQQAPPPPPGYEDVPTEELLHMYAHMDNHIKNNKATTHEELNDKMPHYRDTMAKLRHMEKDKKVIKEEIFKRSFLPCEVKDDHA